MLVEEAQASAEARLTALADSVDCLTEDDMALLSGNSLTTLKAWRKRGEGPAYIRAGVGRYLYPRRGVAEWLQTRVRDRRPALLGAGL